MPMRFRKFAPLIKVNEATREIDVLVTAEKTDLAKEKLDWETTRPFIVDYSESVRKTTEALGVETSLGNVRVMHEKTIGGKFTDIILDDEAKQWTGTIKVKDGEPWEDVLSGHVTGVSIGGVYVKRWDDPVENGVKRYTAKISEVSLVDRPCLDEATFLAVRKDGSSEMRKFAPRREAEQFWSCHNEECLSHHVSKRSALRCSGPSAEGLSKYDRLSKANQANQACACCTDTDGDCGCRTYDDGHCRCHADCANCVEDGDCEGLAAEKVCKTDASETETQKKAAAASEAANGYAYKAPEGRDAADYHRKAQAAHDDAAEAHREASAEARQSGDNSTARRHATKADQHDDHAAAHGAIAAAHEAATKAVPEAEMRKADTSEGETKYGDVKFADEKNKKYPIDTEEHIRAAWNYISKPKNADKYSADDIKTIKAKIVAAWKEKIDKDGPPSATKAAANGLLGKCLQCVATLAYSTQSIDAIADGIHCEACGAYGCNCSNCTGPGDYCCYACSMRIGVDAPLSEDTEAIIEDASSKLFDALVSAAEDCRDADAAEDEEETPEGTAKVLDALVASLRKSQTLTTFAKSLRATTYQGRTDHTLTKTKEVSAMTTKGAIACNDPVNPHMHEGGICKADAIDSSVAPVMKALGGIGEKLDGALTKYDDEIGQMNRAITTLTKSVEFLMNQPASAPRGALRVLPVSVTKSQDAALTTETTTTETPVATVVKYHETGVEQALAAARAVITKGMVPIAAPVSGSVS